ncbi:DUF4258 domain-containing protein [Bdellovibrionota bacterium FG-1]
MDFKFSQHATEKVNQREIPLATIEGVINNPQQSYDEDGKTIFQSKLERSSGNIHLLRVIISRQVNPAVVLTVYWTDRIEKYWRQS